MNPSRRSVLAGGAVGLAVACTTPKISKPVMSADDRRRAEAAIREEALLQLYAAVLLAYPSLAPALEPLRADHVAHRQALGAAEPVVATATPALVGPTAEAARKRLAALESATAAEHAAAALVATTALSPLLASLSACESSHAALL